MRLHPNRAPARVDRMRDGDPISPNGVLGAVLLWIGSAFVFGIATVAMATHRESLENAHVILVYLLLVLAGSARGGRVLGITLSICAFVSFDLLFLPPYDTLVVRNPLDWLVLAAFLVTSLVAAQLLYKARAERAAVEHANALHEADGLKDALLAAVSHDLRTPLTTIKGIAREIHETAHEVMTRERATFIEEQADRLNALVTNLLDVARLNAGALPLTVDTNAAEDVLGAVMKQFLGRADRHRVHVHMESRDILLGRFDFVQTLRVLTNLVENALKYAPIDTPIDVRALARHDRLVFEVLDRGPGVPLAIGDRLFEPFTKGRIGPPDAGSSGLGLSIARRLVEAQGGTLVYHPRADGGSRFAFDVPLATLKTPL